MDQTYQQAIIQALMGNSYLPRQMTGQNATTSYGQGFMTGNMINSNNPFTAPSYGVNTNTSSAPSNSSYSSNPYAAMYSGNTGITSNPTTQLLQPMSAYS